jgi:mannose-6-phosphate isomerase-like protein (cupin superfamily)
MGRRWGAIRIFTIPLELIEVQVGSYPGEDDIVRFDDEYGR